MRDTSSQSTTSTFCTLVGESDTEKLIVKGRLHWAVVIGEEEVPILLDGSSPKISGSIMAEVKNGLLPQDGLQNGGRAVIDPGGV